MALIWNNTFTVGVQEFDEHHRKLMGMLTQLSEAMRVGKGKDAVGAILTSLIAYTRSHFDAEERALSKYGYPELAAHKQEHDNLTRKVLDFQQDYAQSRVGLSIPLMTFLENWLKDHILGTDKGYGPFLNGKGVK